MSVRAMAAVWEMRSVLAPERLVLLAFADVADDYGRLLPDCLEAVRLKCELSEREFERLLAGLRLDGLVETDGDGQLGLRLR